MRCGGHCNASAYRENDVSTAGSGASTTLQQVLDAGSTAWVLSQLAGGYSQAEVVNRMRERYGGLSLQGRRAAVARAIDAEYGGEELRSRHGTQALKAGDILRPDPGRTWWRYYVLVPVTSLEGTVHHIPITLNSAQSMTRGDVEEQAQNAVLVMQQEDDPESNYRRYLKGGTVVGTPWVSAVERTSPQ